MTSPAVLISFSISGRTSAKAGTKLVNFPPYADSPEALKASLALLFAANSLCFRNSTKNGKGR